MPTWKLPEEEGQGEDSSSHPNAGCNTKFFDFIQEIQFAHSVFYVSLLLWCHLVQTYHWTILLTLACANR